MTLKFAVIGETGQLARALKDQIKHQNYQAVYFNRSTLDLSSSSAEIEKVLENIPPVDAVILAAAYTAVDKAEKEMERAMKVNGRSPGLIAKICKKHDIPLVHFSTDYVFNGKAETPYKVSDKPQPINAYGQSKYKGERLIKASGCRHAILRTSWVFDGNGQNFLTTMLQLAQSNNALNIVDDQRGRPTYAGHLARAGLSAARGLLSGRKDCCGIFHVSNTGSVISWAEFAEAIFAAEKIEAKIIKIPTSEYPTPARRPAYSALDTEKFESLFDYKLPNWQEGLKAALAER